MNITVTVDAVSLDAEVPGWAYDDEGERQPARLVDLVVRELVRRAVEDQGAGWDSLARAVAKIRTEVIRAKVEAEVEAALTAEFRPTNSWGEPTGEPTTLRALIAKQAQEAVKMGLARPGYREGESTAMRVIRDQVNGMLAKELAEAVAEEKAKVVAAVRAKAAEMIAQAVAEGVGGKR